MPRLCPRSGSSNFETRTMPLSQTAIWPGVGIDWRSMSRFASEARSPTESRDRSGTAECRRRERPHGRTRITAVMADDLVERREQPVMGGRQRDDMAARLEHPGRAGQLGAVILDMFEHVDVEQGIVRRLRLDLLEGPHHLRTARGQAPLADGLLDLSSQHRVGSRHTQRL